VFNEFYGLTLHPFRLGPDPRFCYRHRSFIRAKHYMHYALHQGEGFVMVTGQPGTGKTILIEDLLSETATSSVKVARIASTQVAADDLLHLLANAFGIDTRSMTKSMVLLNLQSRLKQQMGEGRSSLLIVDEAQNLPFESMEELRMITNLQEGATPLLQVFLVGQDRLRSIIAEPRMEQLRQRMLAACRMEPLNPEETRDYLYHRLRCAGWGGSPTICGEGVWLLHGASGGVPRVINVLANRLLLWGWIEEKKELGADDVRVVIKELEDELSFVSSASEKQAPADEAQTKPTPDFRDLAITAPSPANTAGAPASAEPTTPEPAVTLAPEVPAAATVESAPRAEPPSPTQIGIPEEREPGAHANPSKIIEPTSPERLSDGTPAPPEPVAEPGSVLLEDAASVQAPGPPPSAMSQDRIEAHPMRLATPAMTRGRRMGAWVAVAVALAAVSILGILVVQPGPASLREALRFATAELWSFAEALNAPDGGAARDPAAADPAQAREVDAVPSAESIPPDGPADIANSAQSISGPTAPKAEADPRPESSPLVFAAQTDEQRTKLASRIGNDIAAAIPEAEPVTAATDSYEDVGTEAASASGAQIQASAEEPQSWSEDTARMPADLELRRAGNDPVRQTEMPPQEDAAALPTASQSRQADTATTLSTLERRLQSLGYEPEKTLAGAIKLNLYTQISFDTDSAEITHSSRRSIDAIAEALSAYPDVEITVIGHTDNYGTVAYNDNLSLMRANAVAALLRAGGVLGQNISSEGRGEREPLTRVAVGGVPARIVNRRIELVIHQIDTP